MTGIRSATALPFSELARYTSKRLPPAVAGCDGGQGEKVGPLLLADVDVRHHPRPQAVGVVDPNFDRV